MAIDPATAQAIAKAAATIVTDKEKRSKLLYMILIAISIGLVILLIPIYLLTHPMEMLEAAFADKPEEATFVEQYKAENDDKVLVIGDGLIMESVYPLPVKGASITSNYGKRTDPITGTKAFHYGTDFGGVWMSEIFSVADGTVVYVCTEKNNGYGNHMIIQHTGQRTAEDGTVITETFYGLYGHMHDIYMFEGQSVKQGAVIGLMGGDPERDTNPGKSTGPHLHFEIRSTQNGTGIDPTGYIFPASKPEETPESEANTDE